MTRPSKYKEAYNNEVIECLAQGHSVAGFAGSIGVAASVVYEWIKKYPDFADAYAIAKAKAVYFWEKQHLEITKSGKGNITGSIFGLKNRAADEWRDVQNLEHTGKNGGPIKTQETSALDRLFSLIDGVAERETKARDQGRLN